MESSDSDGFTTESDERKRPVGKKTEPKPGCSGTSSKLRSVPKVRKSFVHKYKSEWEKNPEFRPWLKPSKKGPDYFYCKVCNYDMKGGISAVKKHNSTDKHVNNCRVVKSSSTIVASFSKSLYVGVDKQVKEGEIRLSTFIAEHNISIKTSDHLVGLIKAVCPDSQISKKLTSNRTKCTAIIKNVVAKTEFEELVDLIKKNDFSILVDESTDRSSEKHLAIVFRTCTGVLEVRGDFLGLLPIESGTTASLYKLLTKFLDDNNIPFKTNLIGFAADGTNTMMGSKHSLQSLLKADVPKIFIMKCICHSLALCASYACEKLPDFVEDLVRNIYSYFKYSSKRQKEFQQFQVFTEVKIHKLLTPCQTRWLSLLMCINRVIEQYPALLLYFKVNIY